MTSSFICTNICRIKSETLTNTFDSSNRAWRCKISPSLETLTRKVTSVYVPVPVLAACVRNVSGQICVDAVCLWPLSRSQCDKAGGPSRSQWGLSYSRSLASCPFLHRCPFSLCNILTDPHLQKNTPILRTQKLYYFMAVYLTGAITDKIIPPTPVRNNTCQRKVRK